MTFVYLPGKAKYINLAVIKSFAPERSNRVDYMDGTHEQLSGSDAQVLMGALSVPRKEVMNGEAKEQPKRRGRPKKVTT